MIIRHDYTSTRFAERTATINSEFAMLGQVFDPKADGERKQQAAGPEQDAAEAEGAALRICQAFHCLSRVVPVRIKLIEPRDMATSR